MRTGLSRYDLSISCNAEEHDDQARSTCSTPRQRREGSLGRAFQLLQPLLEGVCLPGRRPRSEGCQFNQRGVWERQTCDWGKDNGVSPLVQEVSTVHTAPFPVTAILATCWRNTRLSRASRHHGGRENPNLPRVAPRCLQRKQAPADALYQQEEGSKHTCAASNRWLSHRSLRRLSIPKPPATVNPTANDAAAVRAQCIVACPPVTL
jgi:hypothetical protein